MKILMINTVPTEKNGITSVVFNIIRNMDPEKIRIDLLAINNPSENYYQMIEEYGMIHRITRSIKHPLRYMRELKRLIMQEKYDIVHVHGNSHTTALDLLAAKWAGCKCRIVHAHSTSCKYKALNQILSGLFFATYTYGFACSTASGEWIFGDRSFEVIRNGIEIERFSFKEESRQKIRKQFGLDEDTFVLGHIGDFHTDNKNQKFLIGIVEELKKRYKKIHLLLVGDGIIRKELEELVHTKHLNDIVTFCGTIDNVNEFYSAFDFYLLPSHFEGFSLTVLEAQAAGLDCCVSDRTAIDVGLTGLVKFLSINEGNETWLSCIEECMGKKIERYTVSKEACSRISECGYDIRQECKRIMEMYHDFYTNNQLMKS